MNRDTGNVLLVLVGGALLRISLGQTYLRYVKSTLHVPLIVAGAILVLLGLVSLWRDNPGRRGAGEPEPAAAGVAAARDSAHGEAGGHHHGHGTRMAWLLLAPVFAIFLVAPPALGSYAAERSTVSRVPVRSGDYPPLPAGDPVAVRLDEYEARAVWDGGRTLADRWFRLTGFVTAKPGGGYYLTRLAISCCAADAVPVRILVTGDAPGGLAKDTWIEAVGGYDGVDRSREQQIGPVATIRAESVRTIPAPAEPYET
jgi:uncharacterized repeat protein (TIGR03943 family)